MEAILRVLRAPGARHPIEAAAPTRIVTEIKKSEDATVTIDDGSSYLVLVKPRMLDRWLDKVVRASGSGTVYLLILIALFTWAFLGIPFGQSNTWQVTISDAQAIVNMVFDAFLMRQQLNSHETLMFVAACLRSRSSSHKRMLKALIACGQFTQVEAKQFEALEPTTALPELPAENWPGRISTALSNFLGHIATVCGFWICIFIWIGFGQYCDWSNTWQLYINSATSALMVFMLAFLANIRERHSDYMTKCLEAIWEIDATLEGKLRVITEDTIVNPSIHIPVPKRSRIQRGIDYYADLVGTLIGIAILVVVMFVWLAIGPAMHFNNNWFLLIGTFSGLVGLNDGFVLRNVCTVLDGYADDEYTQVAYDDMDMLSVVGVEKLTTDHTADQSLTSRISVKMGAICSHEITVVMGFVTIMGLLIGATAMHWSLTGQLLCNIPPSIIESFFTMILITGHNIGEDKRRVDIYNLYLRRVKLLSYVESSKVTAKVDVETVITEEKVVVPTLAE